MNPTKYPLQSITVIVLVLFAALTRLFPHPPTFTAVGAVALFGSAYLSSRWMRFLVPLLALWLSDLVLNNIIFGAYFDHFVLFTPGFEWLYGSFVLIVLIGQGWLRKINIKTLFGASITASVIFFLLSNFGIWTMSLTYPQTFSGLLACYGAGVPFFWTTLLGDLFYVGVTFGVYALLTQRYPQLAFVKTK